MKRCANLESVVNCITNYHTGQWVIHHSLVSCLKGMSAIHGAEMACELDGRSHTTNNEGSKALGTLANLVLTVVDVIHHCSIDPIEDI